MYGLKIQITFAMIIETLLQKITESQAKSELFVGKLSLQTTTKVNPLFSDCFWPTTGERVFKANVMNPFL